MFNLFARRVKSREARIRDLEDQVISLENERDLLNDRKQADEGMLRAELRTLKDQIADLKAQRKREDDELKHLVKMTESKLQMDYERKVIELEKVKAREIEQVKDEYRDKLEEHLAKQIVDLKAAHTDLLARLPNIDVALKGRLGA